MAGCATTWCERHGVGYIVALAKNARLNTAAETCMNRAKALYDELYCQRGEMENRIKEQQLGLFADRTSCHHWWPNQVRLILASLAYSLIEATRRLALRGTEMARAQAGTIRLKLLKIGAVVIRNTRRVSLHLSTACPDQALFRLAAARLEPG